jgi:retron-type reverse transcriptase
MTKLQQLKAATDRIALAALLGFKAKSLAYIVYKKPPALKYYPFQIQKRSGGTRTINAPAADLKKLQERLSDLLQDCVSDINEGKKISGAISHGFRRKRSIVTNARCHRSKRWVFNIDLADFFDSINFGRVRGFFLKNNNFSLAPEVATTIAQIACHNNALPQGSPCSPVISNLVAHVLDIRLAKLAEQCGCDYSRYADDLTFSTNKARFPAAIAKRKAPRSDEWEVGKDLQKIIQRSGFSINAIKTRMQYRDSRQDVTGLIVNSKVNVRCEYERAARAMVHHVLTTGTFYTIKYEPDLFGQMEPKQEPGSLNRLQGILSFIDQIKKSNWNESKPRPDKRVGYECTYRDFLFHKEFYASDVPVILCEGKTDNIYLKCAIRNLVAKVPKLAQKSGKAVNYKIRFMSYTDTTARMLNLSGGTGELNLLVTTYRREWKKHLAGHLKQPVIVVVDNDKGSDGVFKAVASVTRKPVMGTEKFIHVCHNLYIVPTPKPKGGGESKIEDFFDPKLLKTKVGGKTFNTGKPDPATEYGKYVFAERVVRPNQATIDFSKFLPILTRIGDAIAHYASQP